MPVALLAASVLTEISIAFVSVPIEPLAASMRS